VIAEPPLAGADHTSDQRQTVAAALRGDSKEQAPTKGRSAYIAGLENAWNQSAKGGN
jgi:hypothetical protein